MAILANSIRLRLPPTSIIVAPDWSRSIPSALQYSGNASFSVSPSTMSSLVAKNSSFLSASSSSISFSRLALSAGSVERKIFVEPLLLRTRTTC